MKTNYIIIYFKDEDRKKIEGFYKSFGLTDRFFRIDAADDNVTFINIDEILSFQVKWIDR